jgi:hypothetical protein
LEENHEEASGFGLHQLRDFFSIVVKGCRKESQSDTVVCAIAIVTVPPPDFLHTPPTLLLSQPTYGAGVRRYVLRPGKDLSFHFVTNVCG